MKCYQKFSWMIFGIEYFPIYRIAANVDIQRRHKDGYLHASSLYVLILFHFFNYHDFSIYRSNDVVRACITGSHRVAKKPNHETVQYPKRKDGQIRIRDRN